MYNPLPSNSMLNKGIGVGGGGGGGGGGDHQINGVEGVRGVETGSGVDVMAVPIGESYSLLDWGDEPLATVIDNGIITSSFTTSTSAPTSTSTSTFTPLSAPLIQPLPLPLSAPTQSLLSLFILKPPAEQLSSMDSRKFQDLWGKMTEIFSGNWDINLLPNSLKFNENRVNAVTITEIEAAMYELRIMVMASGPAPTDSISQNNGFKFFLYGIESDNLLLGSDGATFLAQLIFFPSSKEHSASISATVKSNCTTDKYNGNRNDFSDLILQALSLAYASSSSSSSSSLL